MFPQIVEIFICVNLHKSADKSGLPFTLSPGKSENNNPENPWPRPGIKNTVGITRSFQECIYTMLPVKSRQGRPVDPV
jgi:hypothetical protein